MKLAWVWRAGITLMLLGLTSITAGQPAGINYSMIGLLLASVTLILVFAHHLYHDIRSYWHRRNPEGYDA